MTEQQTAILRACGRSGTTGATVAAQLGIPARSARKKLNALEALGLLVRVEPKTRNDPTVWRLPGAYEVEPEKPSVPPMVTIKTVAPMKKDVRVTMAKGVKITRDVQPRPTARYQVLQLEPDPRYPSFVGRIGKYDEVTE